MFYVLAGDGERCRGTLTGMYVPTTVCKETCRGMELMSKCPGSQKCCSVVEDFVANWVPGVLPEPA